MIEPGGIERSSFFFNSTLRDHRLMNRFVNCSQFFSFGRPVCQDMREDPRGGPAGTPLHSGCFGFIEPMGPPLVAIFLLLLLSLERQKQRGGSTLKR